MTFSRIKWGLLVSVAAGLAGTAGFGQGIGLPLADTANSMPAGLYSAAAAVTLSDDYDFYGANAPFDLALRGTAAHAFTDHALSSLTGMLVASAEVYFVGYYLYGGFGGAYTAEKKDKPWGGSRTDTEFDLIGTVGNLFCLTQNWSIFGEVSYLDQPLYSAGMRFQF
jgi:hypothetical protein